MQNRGMSGLAPSSSLGNSSITNQPSPGAESYTSPHLQQTGVVMKSSTGPSVGALQAGQQVQAEPARQTVPHMVATAVNYGKDNLVVSTPTPGPNLIATQQQMQPHKSPERQSICRRPKSQLIGSSGMSDCIGNTVAAIGPPQVMPNPAGPSLNMPRSTTQALQQLLQTLKSPISPEQQQQVLGILKSNPQLVADFIKQRTEQQQQQQQQQQ